MFVASKRVYRKQCNAGIFDIYTFNSVFKHAKKYKSQYKDMKSYKLKKSTVQASTI